MFRYDFMDSSVELTINGFLSPTTCALTIDNKNPIWDRRKEFHDYITKENIIVYRLIVGVEALPYIDLLGVRASSVDAKFIETVYNEFIYYDDYFKAVSFPITLKSYPEDQSKVAIRYINSPDWKRNRNL